MEAQENGVLSYVEGFLLFVLENCSYHYQQVDLSLFYSMWKMNVCFLDVFYTLLVSTHEWLLQYDWLLQEYGALMTNQDNQEDIQGRICLHLCIDR